MGDLAKVRVDAGAVIWRRAGRLASRRIAGETILVPIRGDAAQLDSVFTLNPVAATIWNALARPADEESLAARVVAEFEVDAPAARNDVRSFLRALAEEGLVEPEEATP